MKRALLTAAVVIVAAAWFARAELLRLVPTPLLPVPAHDQYAAALALSGLSSTSAGRAWLEASDLALHRAVEVPPSFSAAAPAIEAASPIMAWRFPARRGQRVSINVAGAQDTVFLDLFADDGRKRVASAPPRSSSLSYIVEDDGTLVARAQPRLAMGRPEGPPQPSGAVYDVEQRLEASLRFPVQGAAASAVQSEFGSARDSGRRRHEGIDIFAPRGTPVIAATDGWITRQTTNRLGGNVVWLWVPSQRMSLYYAHLDRHAVTPGERVMAGDTIGYVGNTGNARGTSPHLHFGVYASLSRAVDPLPYVVDPVMHSLRPNKRRR
jgi:murein DD-endopeptidase MepM/ murein hydrolase activator NlpD